MPYLYRWRAWRLWGPVWLRRTLRVRGIRAFVQRGRRGWADEDLWQFDHHLGRVISGGLRQMAATTAGWPAGEPEFDSFEDWQRFLVGIADDLDAWVADDSDFMDRGAFERARAAMRRLADQYGSYWD